MGAQRTTTTGRSVRTSLASIALALLLAACGGGGDDDRSLPPLSTDEIPAGARVDVSALDLLPFHATDTWVYARTTNGSASGFVTRLVSSGPDGAGLVSVTEFDAVSSFDSRYRISAAGLEELDPLGVQGILPGVYSAFPSWTLYPTPFYPAGSTRRYVRQGSMNTDIDGDLRSDSFRLEVAQVFVGFEILAVLGAPAQVAHILTTYRFEALASSTGARGVATAVEDSYLASGLGLVRADRSATSDDGTFVEPPYTLVLQSATVAGISH